MLRLIAVTCLALGAAVAQAQQPTAQSNVTKILGGAFDPAFQEQAPEGGLLIGFEISLGKFGDREVIRSLRPIYRTANDEEVRGKQYGAPQGTVYVAKAKAGYAVAGLKVRTGMLIDGLSVIFMKTKGDGLDPYDAYGTAWLGNQIGGSPSTLAGNGSPIVGFAAKTKANNTECSGLGLVLKYAPSTEPVATSGKLSRANFNQIQNGMTENQVRALMGPPTSSSQRTAKVLTWRQFESDSTVTATVTLRGGRVAGTNWQVIGSSQR